MANFEVLEPDSFKDVIPLLKKFHEESPYKDFGFNEERVLKLLNLPNIFVLVDRQPEGIKGVLVAYIDYMIFSQDKLAMELAWYIDPEYRGNKEARYWISLYEYWAKENGCKIVTLVNLADENLDAFYTRLGFVCQEHTYTKEL